METQTREQVRGTEEEAGGRRGEKEGLPGGTEMVETCGGIRGEKPRCAGGVRWQAGSGQVAEKPRAEVAAGAVSRWEVRQWGNVERQGAGRMQAGGQVVVSQQVAGRRQAGGRDPPTPGEQRCSSRQVLSAAETQVAGDPWQQAAPMQRYG